MNYGDYIKEMRIKSSISQRKLSQLSGVANSTISRIESGIVTPDLVTLDKLKKVLIGDKMKITDTQEFKDFLSALEGVDNKELRVILGDVAYEVILKSFGIGYDSGYLKGFERGKDFKNA